MYTPQIYSGTNVHANMPYCETRMKGLPTSIGVMCIHLPTTPFIYHPIHLPLAWRARLLGEGPCTLDKLRVGWRSRNFIFEAPGSGRPLRALRGPHWSGPTPSGQQLQQRVAKSVEPNSTTEGDKARSCRLPTPQVFIFKCIQYIARRRA